MTGTVDAAEVPVPGAAQVLSVSAVEFDGITVTGGPGASSPSAARIVATASATSTPAVRTTEVSVAWCREIVSDGAACPDGRSATSTVNVTVNVRSPGGVPEGYDTPDASRYVDDGSGQFILPDELAVIAAPAATPEAVQSTVERFGGKLTASDFDFGTYRARFDSRPLAEAAVADLMSDDAVISWAEPVWLLDSNTGDPADWSGYGDNWDAYTWPQRQTGLPAAWGIGRGGNTSIGIADLGIYRSHPQLKGVVSSYQMSSAALSELDRVRNEVADAHGTHVAGTACSKDGDGWLVGAAQDCRLHLFDILGVGGDQLLNELKSWLNGTDVRVVNFSWTAAGASESRGCEKNSAAVAAWSPKWREFFSHPDIRNRLFVLAAGNCGNLSVEDSLPGAVADEFDHVVSVGATAKGAGTTLTDFSQRGAEVAAPGAGISGPVQRRNACRDNGSVFCDHEITSMSGTSMAAPMVTGIAALTMGYSPSLSAPEIGRCLVRASTTGPATAAPEISATGALSCAKPSPATPTYTGRVVRLADGRSYYVDLRNTKHWIPDGGTFECLVAQTGPAVDGDVTTINQMQEWEHAKCVKAHRGITVVRHPVNGDAYFLNANGSLSWIRDGRTYECLGNKFLWEVPRYWIDDQPKAATYPSFDCMAQARGSIVSPGEMWPCGIDNPGGCAGIGGDWHYIDKRGDTHIWDDDPFDCPTISYSGIWVPMHLVEARRYEEAFCYITPAAGSIARAGDGDSYLIGGSGELRHITTGEVFDCLRANGSRLYSPYPRYWILDQARGSDVSSCTWNNRTTAYGTIVQQGSASYYIDKRGWRHAIPDGGTFECLRAQNVPLYGNIGSLISQFSPQEPAECVRVNPGDIARTDDGDAYVIGFDWTRRWIETGNAYNCLVARGHRVVNSVPRYWIDDHPQAYPNYNDSNSCI
ncbi:S8 family peptidase [Dermatobacter hominis]|uniref:S8 family peptidase n=1 Tax=Dermatobacter hominis TaxID=2884263 RepID=UPI001D12CFED|nr:S8 family serine peptidase [Dermatobacter hominis]UDY36279.1 S8 family peptidase [Dermatobacter hominis]